MPDRKRTSTHAAIFALAIVKSSVISSRMESSKVEAALQSLFPGVSIILVAEDDSIPTHERRQELSDFADRAQSKVIPSSKISAN
jgi:hypothetical protein